MGRAFSDITFTPAVRAMQSRMGSREQYAGFDHATDPNNSLRGREIDFISSRDHFYQATVSETGWPYVQHRGGPAGFLKVLDSRTIGFADFTGNVQYISVGNLQKDNRISLILMDYAEQIRLKLVGRVRLVELDEDPQLVERVRMAGYPGRVERAFIIHVEGYDWNCPQHITPRFTQSEMALMTAPLHSQIKRLQELASALPARLPASELGTGELALRITGMRQVTAQIRALELRSADGAALPEIAAGGHLAIPGALGGWATGTRCYSIASDPRRRDVYEIAVLREERGRGGSAAVHDAFGLGLVLHCALPRNDFALRAGDAPVILIAGGIGITALRAMAMSLMAQGRSFQLHYAARSRAHAAFADELHDLLGHRFHFYPSSERRLDLDHLFSHAPQGAVFYACGPGRMIDAVLDRSARAGIASERVHLERFAAAGARGGDKSIQLTLSRSARRIEVLPGQSILDAVQDAGIAAPASCRAGNCGSCAVDVLDGVPDHRDTALTQEERDAGRMCICVSRAIGDALALDL